MHHSYIILHFINLKPMNPSSLKPPQTNHFHQSWLPDNCLELEACRRLLWKNIEGIKKKWGLRFTNWRLKWVWSWRSCSQWWGRKVTFCQLLCQKWSLRWTCLILLHLRSSLVDFTHNLYLQGLLISGHSLCPNQGRGTQCRISIWISGGPLLSKEDRDQEGP